MNTVMVLFLFVGVPFVIWMGYDIYADWRDSRHPFERCSCTRRVLRGGHEVFDHTDLLIHGVGICQPYREWIDD